MTFFQFFILIDLNALVQCLRYPDHQPYSYLMDGNMFMDFGFCGEGDTVARV